jgi:hypothetical protein
MRIQLALNVSNLEEPGYANFAIDHPPLKLVLFETPGAPERLNHLGVEVFESEQVTAATDRLKAAGLVDRVEDETTCCYATQSKVWAKDPDGARWEWYRLLRDSESFGASPAAEQGANARA